MFHNNSHFCIAKSAYVKLNKVQKVKSILHKGFLILWAAAIFWFYLGNLVNFHQNRIWGKYLIPSCYTHSSVNKQDFGTLQNDDHTALLNLHSYNFDEVVVTQFEFVVDPLVLDTYYTDQDYSETLVSDPPISANSLRGPPIA